MTLSNRILVFFVSLAALVIVSVMLLGCAIGPISDCGNPTSNTNRVNSADYDQDDRGVAISNPERKIIKQPRKRKIRIKYYEFV